MPKDYTASKVENLLLRIKFATPTDPISKTNDLGETEYYAAEQILQCIAKNGIMSVPCHIERKYYGNPKAQPWKPKQVGDAMKNFSTLNTVIYTDIKALYLDAINENIS